MKAIALITIASLATMMMLSGVTVAQERICVSTDKTVYAVGENVVIELTNNANEPYLLKGYFVTDSYGECIYIASMLAFTDYLEPGESVAYVWYQVDESGNQVPDGIYTITIGDETVDIRITSETTQVSLDGGIANGVQHAPIRTPTPRRDLSSRF